MQEVTAGFYQPYNPAAPSPTPLAFKMMDSANIADMSELSASKLSDPSILNILEERYAQATGGHRP